MNTLTRFLKRTSIWYCYHHWHATGDTRGKHEDWTCRSKREAECQWECCICGRREWMPSFVRVGGFIMPLSGTIAEKSHR